MNTIKLVRIKKIVEEILNIEVNLIITNYGMDKFHAVIEKTTEGFNIYVGLADAKNYQSLIYAISHELAHATTGRFDFHGLKHQQEWDRLYKLILKKYEE